MEDRLADLRGVRAKTKVTGDFFGQKTSKSSGNRSIVFHIRSFSRRRARKTRAHILRHSTNIEEGREEGLLEEEKLGWNDVRREDLRID